MTQQYRIHQGDNVATLAKLADNSVDSVVTDPPYGIDFLGKDWDSDTGSLETYRECLRVLKPGGYILAFSAARTYHHLATTIERAGFEIRDQLMWLYGSGFPKAQDLGRAIQKRQGVEETKDRTLGASGGYKNNAVGGGLKQNTEINTKINEIVATSPEARQWSGWKTALKPAHEPIVMARKPFKGSCLDNVLANGVGALNIDATRIPTDDKLVGNLVNIQTAIGGAAPGDRFAGGWKQDEAGRYPSNVIGEVDEYQKYFYSPKVSRSERHVGFEDNMPPTNGTTKMYGKDQAVVRETTNYQSGNNHPTVKPVALMRYLIKLVTPENSVVLDPYSGSGSTGMAAVELGHQFIGCELDPDYVAIAERRIQAWNKLSPEEESFDSLLD